MKKLNREQLFSVSGGGIIAAGTVFAGIVFDISAVIISEVTGDSNDIVFADHKEVSRDRYDIM